VPEKAALCRSSSTLNSDYILSMKRTIYSSLGDVRLPLLFTIVMFLLLAHVGSGAQGRFALADPWQQRQTDGGIHIVTWSFF
jgi:hypothetical protein